MRYDLHTHSDYSDGALSPAEVVRAAALAGLDGLALTDHDGTAGLAEARVAGEQLGIEVLPGCEVSTVWNDSSVHVLAYFMDAEDPRFVEEMRWIRDDRVVRAEKMVEKLAELGYPVTMEQVRRIAGGAAIGRPHVAAALVESGVVRTTPEAFTPELIADGGAAYVQKRVMTPHDTVSLILSAGGVAVLAHPIWVENVGHSSEMLVEELAALGMQGIEIDHPEHDEPVRARFRRYAERLGLVVTASSDFHGNAHGGAMGAHTADEDVVARLRALSTAYAIE